MDGTELGEAVEVLRAGVDGLLAVDLSGSTSTDVVELLGAVEVQRRRLEAVDHRLLAEVGERGTAGDYTQASTMDLLVSLLRASPREAKARVARAGDLGPRRELTGAPLPPVLPRVADAVRAGSISVGHVAVITRCLDAVPAEVAYEVAPVAERFLVEAAAHEDPRTLERTAGLLLARLDPDGAEPREAEVERRRCFTLSPNPDGSATARGRLTGEASAVWQVILDSLGAPVGAGEDGEPDHRSAGQRRHDALLEAGLRLLRSDSLPDSGGVPVTILASTTIDELRARVGVARTGHGELLPIRRLLDLACEAEIVPVVCDDAGGVVGYGRTRRLASRGQRLALAVRDGGCCFPACDRPAAWTQAHHVIPWIEGGPTDLSKGHLP